MKPTIAWNVLDLKRQYENKTQRGHWFDKDTMRFFNTRLTSQYKRVDDSTAYFITTERGPDNKRHANIRKAVITEYTRADDGFKGYDVVISTVNEFGTDSLVVAIRKLGKL